MSIELAPRSKQGLLLHNPVMLAAGAVGLGDAWPRDLHSAALGAVVVGPVSRRPRRAVLPVDFAEVRGGYLLNSGGHNPGLQRVLRRFALRWRHIQSPLIVHLLTDEPDDVIICATELSRIEGVAAVELGLDDALDSSAAMALIQRVRASSELPLLVKAPLTRAGELAPLCAEAGAHALVVGAAPWGLAQGPSGWVRGRLHGPLVLPQTLHALQQAQACGLPLVACGGIHSIRDARACLEAGASAVQIESGHFVEPALPVIIAQAWAETVEH